MKKTLRLIAICGLAMTIANTAAWAGNEKLAAELQSQRSGGKPAADNVEVIVQYAVTPTEAHHQRVAALGGKLHARMDYIKAAHYTVPRAALQTLANDPEVAYVTPDRKVKATFDNITDGTVNSFAGFSAGWNGVGVGIAVIDSGVTDMGDFHDGAPYRAVDDRIVYQQSFVGGTAADQYGHGTHVAGILAGNGYGGVYTGTVLEGNIISLKVLDQNGNGTDSNVIQAIDTAISLKSKYNIKVINLSLGRPVYEFAFLDPLDQAVEAAWRAGIVVVVAAGNEGRNNAASTNGYGTITSPGNDPYVITVGCVKSEGTTTRADDRIASYSSKGPTLFDHYVKPDVVAPGNLIVSTMPAGLTLANEYPANRLGTSSYFTLSGTSMATPVVAGMAAMLTQGHPSWTPDQVKAAIMKTSSKNNFPTTSVAVDPVTGASYTSYYDIFTVGAGEVDMLACVQLTDVPPSVSAKSPYVAYDLFTGKVNLQGIAGSSVVWGTGAVWGTSVVWGTNVVVAGSTVWGSGTVWGTSSMQGFSAVWGSSTVWGSSSSVASESDALLIHGEQ